jgi:hypothetical protein
MNPATKIKQKNELYRVLEPSRTLEVFPGNKQVTKFSERLAFRSNKV